MKAHWTARSTEDFLYRIASDYVNQLEDLMDKRNIKRARLAKKLGVSKGRVSQVFNNPGNFTIRSVVEYARALGGKVALVAYDDGDSANQNGPIRADVFVRCWTRVGKPTDILDLDGLEEAKTTDQLNEVFADVFDVSPTSSAATVGQLDR